MKKILANWQMLLRVVIVLVSAALVVAGFYNLKNYFRDRASDKNQVTALIVKNTKGKDDQLLEYEFEGKTYQSAPVDKTLHKYGELGDEIKISIQTDRPQRSFIKRTAFGEATAGMILLGWGILLGLIVWAEGKILRILNRGKVS